MKNLLIISFGLLLFNSLSAQKYTTKYITEANKVGLEWWEQVNTGQYEDAYNLFSDIIKTTFTLTNWKGQIALLMDEYGKFESITVTDTYFMNEYEGEGDGFYVFIEYAVKYANTKNHKEFLILKQNDKFKWEIIIVHHQFQNKEAPDKL